MERQMLRLMVVLGALITLLGGTGVFAVFTDSVEAEDNSARSGAVARAADLQIALGDYGAESISCGAFQENLTTPILTATDLQPGWSSSAAAFCLRNVGAASVQISFQATRLVDSEIDCTGDEGATDLTCSPGARGELSGVLQIYTEKVNCDSLAGSGRRGDNLATLNDAARNLPGDDVLLAGSTACWTFVAFYPDAALLPAETIQNAQSDSSTWSFFFIGQAT